MSNSKLSRRTFLKRFGTATATLVGAQLLSAETNLVHASGGTCECECDQTPGVLIDLTRCAGCNSCARACKESNNLPETSGTARALGSDTYSLVETHWVATGDGGVEPHFVKRQCMHCLHAACVAACPAAAMYQSEEGPVIYRSERCLGCRYCQAACPFGVPCFEWDNGTTPVISKCFMCIGRLREGLMPACVEACPAGALRFGQRNQLLIQAHAQIAAYPGRYVDHIFGEYEVGGTSMLYISGVPFDQLGFPTDMPHEATPEGTEKILTKLPFVLLGMATLMGGTAAYTHRGPAVPQGPGELVQVHSQAQESPPLSQGPQADQAEE